MLYQNVFDLSWAFLLEENLQSWDRYDHNCYVVIKVGKEKLIIDESMFKSLYIKVDNPKDLLKKTK